MKNMNIVKVKLFVLTFLIFALGLSCTTLPSVEHKTYHFPEKAFFDEPKNHKFEKLGLVRAKVNFPTLDPDRGFESLCSNYFNKAIAELVEIAEKKDGDAVMQVRSVVFLMDGRREEYPKAECADDGEEGQVLVKGIAIKWILK